METDSGTQVLGKLLKRCVELAREAGNVIRSVQADREAGKPLDASLKDADDPRTYLTVADQRAQQVVVNGLRDTFGPNLQIIGEEDEDDIKKISSKGSGSSSTKLESQATQEKLQAGKDLELQLPPVGTTDLDMFPADFEEVCVFVDPVDGTREFVEGRLMSCQTLIGIAWRGRPVAGVMNLPFHDGKIGASAETASQAKGHCLYGIVGGSLHGLDIADKSDFARSSSHGDTEVVAANSAKIKEALLQEVAASHIKADHDISVGGCGNKVLRLLTGQADVALFNLASSLWDSCAPEALLTAQGQGGLLTTLAGHPIEHTGNVPTLVNRFGVIATGPNYKSRAKQSHEELCDSIRAMPELAKLYGLQVDGEGEPAAQALDVARDLNGQPLTVEKLGEILQTEVTGFCADESSAVRYKQSAACRIKCYPSGSIFYKRIVLREMPFAIKKSQVTPYKILRDVKSSGVEFAFVGAPETKLFAEMAKGKPCLALPYRIETKPRFDVPLDSRFAVFLPDLRKEDGWLQFPYLNRDQLQLCMETLANFHAFYWVEGQPANAPGVKLAPQLWETGSYWHLGQQPKGQLNHIISTWARIHESFGLDQDMLGLGSLIRDLAEEASIRTHGIQGNHESIKVGRRIQTIVHGDAKSPNFFFKENSEDVGLIDFQWSGLGIAAADVAYSIAASGDVDSFSAIQPLVEHYHTCLQKALASFAPGVKAPTLQELREDFDWAWIDLTRVVFTDHWKTITPEVLKAREGAHTFNAYNKSFPVALAFLEVTSEIALRIAAGNDSA